MPAGLGVPLRSLRSIIRKTPTFSFDIFGFFGALHRFPNHPSDSEDTTAWVDFALGLWAKVQHNELLAVLYKGTEHLGDIREFRAHLFPFVRL